MELSLSFSTIATLVYFCCFVVLLFVIAVFAHRDTTEKSFVGEIWHRRKLYGSVLVAIYDIATDIGVL